MIQHSLSLHTGHATPLSLYWCTEHAQYGPGAVLSTLSWYWCSTEHAQWPCGWVLGAQWTVDVFMLVETLRLPQFTLSLRLKLQEMSTLYASTLAAFNTWGQYVFSLRFLPGLWGESILVSDSSGDVRLDLLSLLLIEADWPLPLANQVPPPCFAVLNYMAQLKSLA